MSKYRKLLTLGGGLAALVTLGACSAGFGGTEDPSDYRMTGMNGPRAGFDWPSPAPATPAPTPAPTPAAPGNGTAP